MDALSRIYASNTLFEYLVAVAVALGIPLFVWVVKRLAILRMRKLAEGTGFEFDDVIVDALERTKMVLVFVVAAYAGLQLLEHDARVGSVLRGAAIVAGLIQVGIWVNTAARSWVRRFQREKAEAEGGANLGAMNMLIVVVRAVVWGVLVLVALANFGVNVSALVAGLGIGGIAIALAVQNILGDLFSSVSILLDKPFAVGHFLIIGDFLGTVENIGVKTTRLRSLSGEQIVFSNSDLLNARIRNYKRMVERRVVFEVGVVYQTSAKQLEQIPTMIKRAVEEQSLARFDRCHFKSFGDSALVFETVYYVTDPDYNLYMDVQQEINLYIVRAFEGEGIVIAYPTRTLFIESSTT